MLTDITIQFEHDTGFYKVAMLKDGCQHVFAGTTVKEAMAELVDKMGLLSPDVILTDMPDLTIMRGILSLFGDNIYRIRWDL